MIKWIYIGGAMLCACALFFWANAHGLGLTSDSYLYLKIAEEWSTDGWKSAGLIMKPPGFPLWLTWWNTNSWVTMNALCLMTTMGIYASFGLQLQRSFWRWSYWGVLVFATPLYLVHAFLWTEPLFMAVFSLLLFSLMHYQQSGRKIWLITAIPCLIFLPFIRLAFWFMLIPAGLWLVWDRFRWKGMASGLLVAVFALTFFSLVFPESFTQRMDNTLAPLNGDAIRYVDNAKSYLLALSLWFVPLSIPNVVNTLVGCMALILMLFLTYRIDRKRLIQTGAPLVFLGYYLLLHLVFRVPYYSAERYLAVLYPWMLVSAFYYLNEAAYYQPNVLRKLLTVATCLIMLYTATRTLRNVSQWHKRQPTSINAGTPARCLRICSWDAYERPGDTIYKQKTKADPFEFECDNTYLPPNDRHYKPLFS